MLYVGKLELCVTNFHLLHFHFSATQQQLPSPSSPLGSDILHHHHYWTTSSFTTTLIPLVSLFSHPFFIFTFLIVTCISYYFLISPFCLMDFLIFFIWEIERVLSNNKKLWVCRDYHSPFFLFNFTFCDSNVQVCWCFLILF